MDRHGPDPRQVEADGHIATFIEKALNGSLDAEAIALGFNSFDDLPVEQQHPVARSVADLMVARIQQIVAQIHLSSIQKR